MKLLPIITALLCAHSVSMAQAQNQYAPNVDSPQAVSVTPITPPALTQYEDDTPEQPVLPAVESIQAQQQARINWGVNIGRITARELRYLQRSQSNIEQQRYYAYLDGWFTPEEQQSLYMALNALSERIERSLYNVDTTYYQTVYVNPAPSPLFIWVMPWWNIRPNYVGVHIHYAPTIAPFMQPGYHPRPPHHNQSGNGHGNNHSSSNNVIAPHIVAPRPPISQVNGHGNSTQNGLTYPQAVVPKPKPKPFVVNKPEPKIKEKLPHAVYKNEPKVEQKDEALKPQPFIRK